MDLIRLLREPETYARQLAAAMARARDAGHDDLDGTAGLGLAAFERLFGPGSPAVGTACRPGCAWCCRMMVTATAPEILALAAAVEALPEAERTAARDRVVAMAPAVAGLDRDARRRLGRPCPLLGGDGRCVAYAARPLACRGLESFDAGACRAAMENPATENPAARDVGAKDVGAGDVGAGDAVEVPLSATHLRAAEAVGKAVADALAVRGRDARRIELVRGLAIALARPDARAAWLAGEDVFAGAPSG